MANTEHYNLQKPAVTDYYDVGVPNANMDIIDAALHDLATGKLDTDGDISNTVAATITEASGSYPTFSSGQTIAVILGRIAKFFADLKANCITALSVSGKTVTYTKADGTTGTFTTQDTTYSAATTNAAGLMSVADKTKLNGITAGAAVTGVKGNSESSYRTGNVNLTAANVGAAAASHNHNANAINDGVLAVARGGTGVSALDGTDYSTAKPRKIYAGTGGMTAGSTNLTNGVIYLQYI